MLAGHLEILLVQLGNAGIERIEPGVVDDHIVGSLEAGLAACLRGCAGLGRRVLRPQPVELQLPPVARAALGN